MEPAQTLSRLPNTAKGPALVSWVLICTFRAGTWLTNRSLRALGGPSVGRRSVLCEGPLRQAPSQLACDGSGPPFACVSVSPASPSVTSLLSRLPDTPVSPHPAPAPASSTCSQALGSARWAPDGPHGCPGSACRRRRLKPVVHVPSGTSACTFPTLDECPH